MRMEHYDFYHTTNARRHGVGMLVVVHIVLLAFCGILYAFWAIGMKIEGELLYGIGSVMACVYTLFLVYTLLLVIRGGQWVFAIHNGELRVTSPARIVGETFAVGVADIAAITQVIRGEEHSTFFLVCKDGSRHEITQNSQLDHEMLFARLKELNPDIRKEYGTLSDVLAAR
jgi:hypothetical protein